LVRRKQLRQCEVLEKRALSATTMSALPVGADGYWIYNGFAEIQDNLWTHGDTQYAVWVSVGRDIHVAKRRLGEDAWEILSLSEVEGNPLSIPVTPDLHNSIQVAVDAAGYVHVSGNHHVDSIRYVRSRNPGDITEWVAPGMTGVNEDRVTYPKFVKRRDGTLLCFYRDGHSGHGDVMVSIYDHVAQTWSTLHHPLIVGRSSGVNPYTQHIAVDRSGTIHMMWCWRAPGSAATNHDICYAASRDGGVTWEKSDGAPYDLPIEKHNAEVVVPAASGSGLYNSGGLEIDAVGRPHAAFLYFGESSRMTHVWRDQDGWHQDLVLEIGGRYDLAVQWDRRGNLPMARPCVVTTEGGKVMFVYRTMERPGVYAVDVTPESDEYAYFQIADLDVGDWEPTFDTMALYERQELYMLVAPCLMSTAAAKYHSAPFEAWEDRPASVLRLDLRRLWE